MSATRPLRIAAVGDLHGSAASWNPGAFRARFEGIEEQADVLLLAGDLTACGHPREAELVARTVESLPLKKIAVLGNHELDHGTPDEVVKILRGAGLVVLDGDESGLELGNGVGIAGCKGFCGGFGSATLAPFGERAIKVFVDEALAEQRVLEVGLRKIAACPIKVVLLHYAPIKETLDGEPQEIYPWLGSSRFAETIDRFGATAVFHGHAHHGKLAGHTAGGAPVWNVALPVLQRTLQRPYFVHELRDAPPIAKLAG